MAMIDFLRSRGIRAALRAHLLFVVFAGMLPMGLLAGWLLVQSWQGQQQEVRRGVQDAAVTLASAVRSELDGSVRKLEFLSRSPLISPRTMAGFYKTALEAVASSPEWESVALIRSDGLQVFNLASPFGAPLPPAGTLPYEQRVLREKQPGISDLLSGQGREAAMIQIGVPVLSDGEVRYILSATLSLARFGELLGRAAGSADGLVGIVDGERRFIWRAGVPAESVGTPLAVPIAEAMARATYGIERFVMQGGEPVYASWAPVRGTAWHALYGVPSEPMEKALARNLALMSGGWALCALGGILLTGFLSQRIARSIRLAARAAENASAGKPVPPIESSVTEIDALAVALHRVSERVGREAVLRREAERVRERLLGQEQEARVRAEADNRAKDEFLAMLGHELRNPLAAIVNASHLLKRVDPAAPEATAANAIVMRQSEHLRRLIDDLLDVGRVITGKIALDRRPADLAESVEQALRTLAAAGRTQRHHLTYERETAWVDGDATRLEQIATNLVTNALTYSPAGSAIRVHVRQRGGDAILTVTDEGQGIAREQLPHVFELFYQADQALSRPRGGLGIGLTLVRRLAELHGGSVQAESAGPGTGSTFTVRLPAIAVPTPVQRGVPVRAEQQHVHRILLVEDNEDARATLRGLLELKGHAVIDAPDGAAALLALRGFSPDVALVDIGLPGMNGYQLAREIRRRHGSAIRLIAVSGYGLPEHRRRSAEAGFEGHLVKPVEPAELDRALEGAFSRVA
jgi:signal transduction histidine kinase